MSATGNVVLQKHTTVHNTCHQQVMLYYITHYCQQYEGQLIAGHTMLHVILQFYTAINQWPH